MQYVFDANTFITLFTYYYKARFPSLWVKFNDAISNKIIVSVREVRNEIAQNFEIAPWIKANSNTFELPTQDELGFVEDIFRVSHFQALISKRARLEGKPVADPFVIAKAQIIKGSVVTMEKFHANAAKIPNVCQYFHIPYYTLEKFMEKENWQF